MQNSSYSLIAPLELNLYQIVSSPFCVATSDGQKVFDRLALAIKNGQRVTLSFHNVTTLTPAFLNAVICQLYCLFSEQQIRDFVQIKDISADDLALLKRVVETAKAYFKNPDRFEQAIKEVFNDIR